MISALPQVFPEGLAKALGALTPAYAKELEAVGRAMLPATFYSDPLIMKVMESAIAAPISAQNPRQSHHPAER